MKTRNKKDTKQTLTYGCYKLQITNNYISVLVYAKSFYNTKVNFVSQVYKHNAATIKDQFESMHSSLLIEMYVLHFLFP